MKEIKVPVVRWVLGDAEQATYSGVTTTVRPIYYYQKGSTEAIRAGSIRPDYAGPLMEALSKAK